MRRVLLVCLVFVVFASACKQRTEAAPSQGDAISALVEVTSISDKKLYVYKDYALGWNRFVVRSWIGESGIRPPEMEEHYDQDPYSGVSAIKAKIDFNAQAWGGYIFANGALPKGETEPIASQGDIESGENLSGATTLTIYARGLEGGEKIEFFCGGLGHTQYGASAPYADSTPKISSGVVTLTKEWKPYTISLKGKDLSRIGNGFGWSAYQKNNRTKEQIEFYLDEIYYSFDDDREYLVLPPSYEAYATVTEEYILNTMAYVNDSSAACIALFRAGKQEQATRIANALVFAAENDRSFSDHRLRNGYLCGNIESFSGWSSHTGDPYSLMSGFYHKQTQKWHEDFYAVSTNMTSLAWGILALCEAYEHTGNTDYRQAAQKIAGFALSLDDSENFGFFSGYNGWEGAQEKDVRKPVRDNLEIYAALMRLAALPDVSQKDARVYTNAAQRAETYVLSQYDEAQGCFLPGDGIAVSRDVVLLSDNALAVLILPEKYVSQKERALQYVESTLSVDGGYSCNNMYVDGIYWEGTGLMSLAYESGGALHKADEIKAAMSAAQDGKGMLPSSSIDKLFSGRIHANDNRKIYYFNRKHLGATAFKAFADMGENPFSISNVTAQAAR